MKIGETRILYNILITRQRSLVRELNDVESLLVLIERLEPKILEIETIEPLNFKEQS